MKPGLTEFVRRIPKVELHVHLEGAIDPRTLLRLAKRHRVDLPADSEAGLAEWFKFEDFEHFVDIYVRCTQCLRDPEDFQRLVRDFLELQARQNVVYTEAHFTISTHLANGANGGEVADAMWQAIEQSQADLGVKLRLIPDIVRNLERRRADQTLEWALDNRSRGVVALGLSGIESYSDEPFREYFAVAEKEGLRRAIHAGEHEGPASIHSALEHCGAERIGHGIRALDDPELVDRLRSQRVPIEVCPSSNVRLGAAESIESHPIGRMIESGLEATINSDDPAFFDTTLTREYERVSEAFGYGASVLAALSLRAVEHAFLGAQEKQRMNDDFRAQFKSLGERWLEEPVEPGLEPVVSRTG